ncbi:MAG: hypothetical protein AB1758_13975 [Candidatus Eremiobacterota bacterium]
MDDQSGPGPGWLPWICVVLTALACQAASIYLDRRLERKQARIEPVMRQCRAVEARIEQAGFFELELAIQNANQVWDSLEWFDGRAAEQRAFLGAVGHPDVKGAQLSWQNKSVEVRTTKPNSAAARLAKLPFLQDVRVESARVRGTWPR